MAMSFYISASLAVLAMGSAMIVPHAIHALLCAIFSLICMAISMYALSAPLAASLQVIVYAGAIMVLFVFAVMFLQVPATKNNPLRLSKSQILLAAISFLAFWAELCVVLNLIFENPSQNEPQSTSDIAEALFFNNGFLLEVISFVLLAGLIAAVFVGRRFMAQHHLLEDS